MRPQCPTNGPLRQLKSVPVGASRESAEVPGQGAQAGAVGQAAHRNVEHEAPPNEKSTLPFSPAPFCPAWVGLRLKLVNHKTDPFPFPFRPVSGIPATEKALFGKLAVAFAPSNKSTKQIKNENLRRTMHDEQNSFCYLIFSTANEEAIVSQFALNWEKGMRFNLPKPKPVVKRRQNAALTILSDPVCKRDAIDRRQ